MRRILLINLIVVLGIVIVAGVVGYLVYNNYYYYSTDDAQVSGNIVNIVPTISGTLESLTVSTGDYVNTNQVIGTVQATGTNAIANVTAPFTGVVVAVPGVVGQIVTPQLALVQEADPSSVKITAYVDESVVKNVAAGQFVDIHVDAYSGTSYTGHISQVVGAAASQFSLLPTTDNASGNFTKVSQRIPVQIIIDSSNPGQALLPGMSAEVTIHLH
jgi:multidrug resistance efflux pump